MLQRRGDANLREEPRRANRLGQLVAQHLDRHATVVFKVAREVHRGHAAASDLTLDGVVARERLREAVGERCGIRRHELHGGRSLEEVISVAVLGEQRHDFRPQRLVALTCVGNDGVAIPGRARKRDLHDRIHGAPSLWRHW